MNSRRLKVSLALSGLHFTVVVFLCVYALSAGFETFDHPRAEPLFLADTAAATFEVLAQPYWTVHHWLPRNRTVEFEFVLLVLNSLFWGCCLSILMEWIWTACRRFFPLPRKRLTS